MTDRLRPAQDSTDSHELSSQNFEHRERERLLRLPEIIGDPHKSPPIPGIIPMSRSSWYRGIAADNIPRPLKIGHRSYWRATDVYRLIDTLSAAIDDQE